MANFYTSSPTVVLPPNGPTPYAATGHYADQPLVSAGALNQTAIPHNGFLATNSGSLAGRKRSRGDVHAPVDDDEGLGDGSVPTPPNEEADQTLSRPDFDSGMNIDAPQSLTSQSSTGSQSGIWGAEQSERESVETAGSTHRPSITSRKSQRLGSAAGGDDLAQLVLPPQMRDVTTEPLIDEATRTLGISWTRMDSSEALRISQAAYSKWIRNHYPGLSDVAVWFENCAIPGYLVAALNKYNGQHEYYIFSHDLTEARLVTSEPSQLVPRLKMLPALHLAAPGGCIRAETDTVSTAQRQTEIAQVTMANGDVVALDAFAAKTQASVDARDDSVEPLAYNHMCAAHAMETD